MGASVPYRTNQKPFLREASGKNLGRGRKGTKEEGNLVFVYYVINLSLCLGPSGVVKT